MAKPIYSDGAVSKLAAPVTAEALSITVLNGEKFPNPIVGDESFLMTLVGSVSQAAEIVICTARNGDSMTIKRGQQGTTAQAFDANDQAYHALTAQDADNFRDAMYYYLGSHSVDPAVDNYGGPLVAGMLYFNTTGGGMREYTGVAWQRFAALVSLAGLVASLWDAAATIAPGDPVIWPSDNGNSAPEYDASDVYTVYVNGIKLQDADEPNIEAGFNVTNVGGDAQITLTAGAVAPFTMTITNATINTGDYLERSETSAGDWSSLGTSADMSNGVAGKLADAANVVAYSNAGDNAVLSAAEGYADGVGQDAEAYADASVIAGPPYGCARTVNAQLDMNANIYYQVPFPVEQYMVGMSYSDPQGLLIAKAGWYHIDVQVMFNILVDGPTIFDLVVLNGTNLDTDNDGYYLGTQRDVPSGANNRNTPISASRVVYMEVGDRVNVLVRNRELADRISPSANNSWMNLTFLGEWAVS